MGQVEFPPCYLTWGQTMVEVMQIMVTSFKRPHTGTAKLSAPSLQQATADPRHCRRLLDTHGQVWVILLWGHCSFLLGSGAHKVLFVPSKICFPVLWKSWWLYGGVNGDLLQEGLYHTQVYCTQSPCPCGSPLLTRTSSGDTQTQVCLSHCWVSGSCCAQSMFEPSEHLWQVWGLILKMILPLLPSPWGFSFALGHGVSPQSCSSTTQPQLQCLLACWGFSALGCAYLLTANAAPLQSLSWRSQRRPQDDGLWWTKSDSWSPKKI